MVMTMRIRNAQIRKFAVRDFRPLPSSPWNSVRSSRERAIRNERKDIYRRATRRNKHKSKRCSHGLMIRLPILFHYVKCEEQL